MIRRTVQIWRADKNLRVGVIAALGGAVTGFALALALRAPAAPETLRSSGEAVLRSSSEAIAQKIRTPVVRAATRSSSEAVAQTQYTPEPQPAAKTYVQEPEIAALTPAPEPETAVLRSSSEAVAQYKDSPRSSSEAIAQKTYAPPPVTDNAPLVAIVIDDVGLNRARTDEIIALDAPLTLSFLTYAKNLPAQTRAARARGHETMLHVAMEPISPDADPGPEALLTSHSEAEILRRLRRGLGRFEGAAGVNNHMGSKFTADSASLMTVMAELNTRGLYFLDSRTSARSAAADVAFEFGVPFAVRDVFLDDAADTKTAVQRLAETEALARRRGHAVAIGHPRDATLAALRAWIPQARARGVVIAPVSAVIRRLEAGREW